METGIEISGVQKSFGKKQVLFDVALSLPKGQIFGLLGPSGCGKTTLVKIAAGIEKKDKGTVSVLGEEMPSLKAMAKIGYMAQAAALYLPLSGRENLSFFGKLYGLKGAELRERIAYTAALVDLSGELDKKTENYSGGMKQRLSLAIALIAEPNVLLLDEPTVGIDPFLREKIWQELHHLAADGVTILITTHVMDEAEKCDTLAMMRQGSILAVGTAAELKAASATDSIEQAFLYYAAKGGDPS